ncbi:MULTISPECIES: glycosyl transferase family 90 [unclassified Helicobacter]|uniref:glycosyl transferase family 90 n=1 Tax=unclassified Helicobacter TaxID=2593540 RepID=UPI000CF16562|nr:MULTISPECIES: glycosyl transferase family 90 [unclassified Helicobacter]
MLDNLSHNIQGVYFLLFPKRNLEKKISFLLDKYDSQLDYVSKRVNYYCSFDPNSSFSSKQQTKYEILNNGSRYCYDFYEYMRFFNPNLLFHLESGDVNYEVKTPSFCKSRPIAKNPTSNNILLKLDKKRHFNFLTQELRESIPYSQKFNQVFFRGGCYQKNRQDFMHKFFNHPLVNAGHTGSLRNEEFRTWNKGRASIKEHLKYKFIMSLEGNDTATNLKWIMSSNSLVLMPKPKFETWFMEGMLIENHHYLEIRDDFSDLEERVDFILKNPSLAQEIIYQANQYIKQFLKKDLEDLISFLVMRKFFYLTNQIEVSKKEEEIFNSSS